VETSTSPGATDGSGRVHPSVAYLILTHKDHAQVERLAGRILELSPRGQVVVHHDLKDEVQPWRGEAPARAHLVDRIMVEWGGWSIVEATLRMIRFAIEDLGADWFVLISGEHWPVLDLDAWEDTLGQSGVDAYLPAVKLPERLTWGGGGLDGNRFLARCVHRWLQFARPRSKQAHRALAGISKISLWTHPILKLEFSLRSDAWFVGVPRNRGALRGWDLFKGSEWLACSARAARVLLAAEADVRCWFMRSHIPDESYVQTVLHHAPDLVIEDAPVTWVPPEPDVATSGWMLLREQDLPQVMASGVAFARKVDPWRNSAVISTIDAEVDRRRLMRRNDPVTRIDRTALSAIASVESSRRRAPVQGVSVDEG
jgi:hypothetical protein